MFFSLKNRQTLFSNLFIKGAIMATKIYVYQDKNINYTYLFTLDPSPVTSYAIPLGVSLAVGKKLARFSRLNSTLYRGGRVKSNTVILDARNGYAILHGKGTHRKAILNLKTINKKNNIIKMGEATFTSKGIKYELRKVHIIEVDMKTKALTINVKPGQEITLKTVYKRLEAAKKLKLFIDDDFSVHADSSYNTENPKYVEGVEVGDLHPAFGSWSHPHFGIPKGKIALTDQHLLSVTDPSYAEDVKYVGGDRKGKDPCFVKIRYDGNDYYQPIIFNNLGKK